SLVTSVKEFVKSLLNHKNGRVQWESMHCLSLMADLIPSDIEMMLNELNNTILNHNGVIVRDYAIDTISNYASSGPDASKKAYPLLKSYLDLWEGRHAVKIINGFEYILKHDKSLAKELIELIAPFCGNQKGTIKKAATRFIKIHKV
ncbi:MAG TPA: hypothetical protein PK816_18060, partial [Candidatus Cloacimonadota bacterium]|nr:hypothetical protein [Candidatus Cloacimonadota bacterium]